MSHAASVPALFVAEAPSSPERPASSARIDAARYACAVKLMESLLHDVRNPLNALAINAEVLMEKLKVGGGGVVPPSQEKNLKAIREQVQRTNVVLGQFAQFVAPAATRAESNLSDVVGKATEVLGHESRKARVKLETQLTPDLKLATADASAVSFLAMRAVLFGIERCEAGSELKIALERDGAAAVLKLLVTGPSRTEDAEVEGTLAQLAGSLGGSAGFAGREFRVTLPLAG